jgi:hypothetical protein
VVSHNTPNMRLLVVALLLLVTSLSDLPRAHAKLVQWNLNDVTLEDGGKASGYIRVDTDWQYQVPPLPIPQFGLAEYDIKTTAGTQLSEAFEYRPGNSGGVIELSLDRITASRAFFSRPLLADTPVFCNLHLILLFRLPAELASLLHAELILEGESQETLLYNVSRIVTAGEVISQVPEPSVALFFAFGLSLVAFGLCEPRLARWWPSYLSRCNTGQFNPCGW